MKDLTIIKNLIHAMSDYGLINGWTDTEFIDTLVDLGITKEDFIKCNYGDYIKIYFEEH